MGVTILIPTYNMAEYLGPLFESIERNQVLQVIEQIVVVDDASSDATPQVLDQLASDPRFSAKLKVVKFEDNRGRFEARFHGVKALDSEWVLFLDSRLILTPDFAFQLKRVLNRGHATVGWVHIEVSKNVYCLYWQRSHETIFRNHYRISQAVELTMENYDQYLKGTGILLCRTKHFLQVCTDLEPFEIKSDDTLLLKELLKYDRLFIDPGLRILWEPRSNLKDFLLRLFERGPGFVEYHVFHSPGKYAVVVMLVLLLLSGWAGFMFHDPVTGLNIAGGVLIAVALSVLVFAKTWSESLRMMPLHLLSILFFGFGVLRGLAAYAFKNFGWRAPRYR